MSTIHQPTQNAAHLNLHDTGNNTNRWCGMIGPVAIVLVPEAEGLALY